MENYTKLTVGLVGGWFVFAVLACVLGLFTNTSNGIGVAVALAAGVPLVAFGIWLAVSEGFRSFALSLSPRALTLAHSWRILGLVFVLLALRGILPGAFGLSAGIGDMLIGATAPLVALKLATPGHRGSFIAWQLLGMTDLVMAVGLGVTSTMLGSQTASIGPMTVLPLSLVPTFFVPLLFMIHVVCIAQARRWAASGRRSLSNRAQDEGVRGAVAS
ncbi:MAG TPA: hypothetical protein VFZ27_04230 [Terriglobia bacterium]|nr:hypothetical protein [Terriglobia bacterium]